MRWCEEGDQERPVVDLGVGFQVVTAGRPHWEGRASQVGTLTTEGGFGGLRGPV